MIPMVRLKTNKHILKYSLSFVLTVFFLYLAFRGVNAGELWETITNVHWGWIVLLSAGTALSYFARACRWRYLLYPLKEKISLRNSFAGVMIGYMVNNFLPRVGEFVRPFSLAKREGISGSAAFGTIVVERIIDLITFLFIALFLAAVSNNSLEKLYPPFQAMRPFFLGGAVALLVLFIVFLVKVEILFTVLKIISRFLPSSFQSKVDELLHSFMTGFSITKHPGKFLGIGVWSILVWGSYFVVLYIPFLAYGMTEKNGLDFGSAVILAVVSSFAFAFPTPSGFGTYHSFTSFALTELFGVDPVIALSYAIVTHEVGVLITTGFGLFYFIREHFRVSEIVEVAEEMEKSMHSVAGKIE